MNRQVESVIDEIFGLYERYGDENYIGENISQIEHMSQAAQLAIKEGCDDEVVLAAFFHDIGHLVEPMNDENDMDGYGVKDHEKIGADFLRKKGFTEKIATLVESHVAAKRYLTYKDEDYYNALSEASKKTLQFQGGRMSEKEALAFEADPLHGLIIQMRLWDEQAKLQNVPLPDLSRIKNIARKILEQNPA
jgi:phosphonate degradation associated HDIG domain protein